MATNSQSISKLELFIDEKLIGFEQNMAKLQLNDDNDERTIGKNMQPKIIFEELIFDNDNDDNNNSENDETDDNSSLMSTSLSSSSSYVISNSSSSNSALSVPSFFETMDRQYEKRRPPFHQQHSATPTATIRI